MYALAVRVPVRFKPAGFAASPPQGRSALTFFAPAQDAHARPWYLRTNDRFLVDPYMQPDERVTMLVDLAQADRDDPAVVALRDEAWNRLRRAGIRPEQATLVQRLRAALEVMHERVPYVEHPTDDQWFQPVRVTAKRGGMCGDLAALLASILCRMGVQSLMQWVFQGEEALAHHLTLLGYVGHDAGVDTTPEGFAYADPSIPDAQVGETPYEALERSKAWERVGYRKNQ